MGFLAIFAFFYHENEFWGKFLTEATEEEENFNTKPVFLKENGGFCTKTLRDALHTKPLCFHEKFNRKFISIWPLH